LERRNGEKTQEYVMVILVKQRKGKLKENVGLGVQNVGIETQENRFDGSTSGEKQASIYHYEIYPLGPILMGVSWSFMSIKYIDMTLYL
jgi:hypothetical protein